MGEMGCLGTSRREHLDRADGARRPLEVPREEAIAEWTEGGAAVGRGGVVNAPLRTRGTRTVRLHQQPQRTRTARRHGEGRRWPSREQKGRNLTLTLHTKLPRSYAASPRNLSSVIIIGNIGIDRVLQISGKDHWQRTRSHFFLLRIPQARGNFHYTRGPAQTTMMVSGGFCLSGRVA